MTESIAVQAETETLCEARLVSHEFRLPNGQMLPVLEDIDLTIRPNEVVALLGPSGCGKSTLMRVLAGLIAPTSGSVLYHGEPMRGLNPGVAIVFQSFALYPWMTVSENVAFALEAIGRPRAHIREAVPQILELVGLGAKADNLPSELSGGEQQRVAVARAFVNRPLILLADEPTGNLDPTNSETIMALLERINRTGTTVVMATHDKALVDRMRRRVIELDRGELIRDQVRGVYGVEDGLAG